MLVSGTEDGELCLWNMDDYNLQSTIKGKYFLSHDRRKNLK